MWADEDNKLGKLMIYLIDMTIFKSSIHHLHIMPLALDREQNNFNKIIIYHAHKSSKTTINVHFAQWILLATMQSMFCN